MPKAKKKPAEEIATAMRRKIRELREEIVKQMGDISHLRSQLTRTEIQLEEARRWTVPTDDGGAVNLRPVVVKSIRMRQDTITSRSGSSPRTIQIPVRAYATIECEGDLMYFAQARTPAEGR